VNRRSRSACLTGALLTVLLTAAPAVAGYDPDGPQEGVRSKAGMSPLETIAVFVLIPAAIVLVIGGLAWLTGAEKGSRYRPQRGWSGSPIWFAGPPDPAGAVAGADTGSLVRGGASGSW
jgi:hypothetical protein